MPSNTPSIGDIVALNSHPYSPNQTNILIGGEPQLISPLLIVVEIVGDTQNSFDENIGMQIQEKGTSCQCKCIWYSTKSHQFDEAWLSSKVLKIIKIQEPKDSIVKSIEYGTLVTLKSAQLELSKQKSSFSIESQREKPTINPVLSFVSPVMQVIGTNKNDSKEPKFDSKTGNARSISELLVKCKWFNSSSDKMSEKLIPVEALVLIPNVDDNLLKQIEIFITSKTCLKVKLDTKETIFSPQKLKYTHGFYSVVGYDHLQNRITDVELSNFNTVVEMKDSVEERFPNFKLDEQPDSQIETGIKKAIEQKKYIRIKYKDRVGNVTTRTVVPNNTISEPVTHKSIYLISYCLLRNAERYFNIESIVSLEILNLEHP
ncbi:WYL domain-containing protein [Runella limosa]|uniref:WYL domain-containing protein n=1 Tax=Runella limosa TaxID=370978 RepID=UPI0004272657|nr:WYL domain-containing protein [Runella limosa]